MSKLSAQEGRALALTLIALAIGCLLIPPFLSYISTNLIASYVTEEGMKEQYAADAGVEYAVWKLINDRNFLELVSWSDEEHPVSVDMPTSVNDIELAVSVTNRLIPNAWPGHWGGQGAGGASWQGTRYLDVFFKDYEVGWIVGDTGRIMKSYNGGYAWYQQTSTPGDPHLYSISRTITETWVVGDKGESEGTIWHANDEDEEWLSVSDSEVPNLRLRSIFFVDALHAWAVGETGTGNKSTILKTVDGGRHWTQDSIDNDPGEWLNSVFLVADNDGWAVGLSGTILRYDGVEWTPVLPKPTNEGLNQVYFVDEDHGWIVGVGGTILKTWDGGDNWYQQDDIEELGEITTINGISVISTTIDATAVITGWVVANDGNIRVMTKTITETNSWALSDDWNFVESGTGSHLYSVYFTDATHGWAVGDYWAALLYTCDESGCRWFNPNRITDKELRSVWFADDDHGWTVGDKTDIDGEPGDDWIIGVTQDGASWANVEPGQLPQPPTHTIQSLLGVSFAADAPVGWAVGTNGTILKSSDGGATWDKQDSAESENLNAVYAISSTLAYAVGDYAGGYGYIITTTNGTNWSRWEDTDLPQADLHDIHFAYSDSTGWTGWAVGNSGTVIKITNAGSSPSWVDQTSAAGVVPKPLYSVCAVYSDMVWAVGNSATIIVSSNGGDTWSAKDTELPPQLSNANLRAVDFANPTVGYVAGERHSNVLTTLLRTIDGGDSWTPIAKGAGKHLYDVFMVDICSSWAVGEDGIIMQFICTDIGDTGGCGFFDIESVANGLSINSRVHLCLDGMHIDSWEIE